MEKTRPGDSRCDATKWSRRLEHRDAAWLEAYCNRIHAFSKREMILSRRIKRLTLSKSETSFNKLFMKYE